MRAQHAGPESITTVESNDEKKKAGIAPGLGFSAGHPPSLVARSLF
jgi:hypothetical protein